MKRTLSILISRAGFALLFLGVGANAQPPDTIWTKIYGTQDAGYLTVEGMISFDSQSVYVSGHHTALDDSYSGTYLSNISSDGELLWKRNCGDLSLGMQGADMCALGSNRIAIAGIRSSDPSLLIVDSLGNVLLDTAYVRPGFQWFARVASAGEENILISYQTQITEDSIGWMVVTAEGQIVSEGGLSVQNHRLFPLKMRSCPSGGGYVIGGDVQDNQDLTSDALVVRLDVEGNLLWWQSYNHWDDDIIRDVICLSSGEIVLSGSTFFWDLNYNQRPYIMGVSETGDSLWSWVYSLAEHTDGGAFSAITETSGHGIVGSYYLGLRNYLVRFDSSGDSLWTAEYDLPGHFRRREVVAILQDSLDSYYIAGTCVDTLSQGTDSACVIKTTPESNEARFSSHLVPQLIAISVFPNPFNSTTTLTFDLPFEMLVEMSVFDVTGREVMSRSLGRLSAGRHSQRIDGSELATGIYFARVSSGVSSRTVKMVLMR